MTWRGRPVAPCGPPPVCLAVECEVVWGACVRFYWPHLARECRLEFRRSLQHLMISGVAQMDENATRQGRPSPEPLTAERDLYRRLMAQGMGNSQACRDIGINRRTGTRWRYGRTTDERDGRQPRFYPPITAPAATVISARFLSVDERIVIADLRRAGRTLRSIGIELGRFTRDDQPGAAPQQRHR